MKKGLGFLLALLLCLQGSLAAQNRTLSNAAEFSLLTIAPSEDTPYTLYGHTGLRVNDPYTNTDVVFNWGLFDFSKPNFVYRFTKGETDYRLGAIGFPFFMMEYNMRGSNVGEQLLNLTQAEKERIWEALLTNNRPENQVYRYNFFFDNCATRPAEIIAANLEGDLILEELEEPVSFRDLINYCTRNQPWQTFGCDLALGMPTDRLITKQEALFLPVLLRDAYANAVVKTDSTTRQLVSGAKSLTYFPPADAPKNALNTWLTPMVCCWTLFVLILGLTLLEALRKTYFRIVDCILFFIAGAGGVVLWFLCFISTHPGIWPNWSAVWLQPFDLLAVILFAVKRFGKAAFYYHFINFAALSVLLAAWHFLPQHLNPAFIPLVMSLWLRSGYGIYRKIWNIV